MKKKSTCIPTLLSLLLLLTACESNTNNPNIEDAIVGDIRIVVVTPVSYPGKTVIITTEGRESGHNGLLYYWMLGDDSSFSASRDTVRHRYTEPGFYTIILTVRKAIDFSLVKRDTALVEVIDTTFWSPVSLHRFYWVEATIRAVFTSVYISSSSSHDTVISVRDTIIEFPSYIGVGRSLWWGGDSFYAQTGQWRSDQYPAYQITVGDSMMATGTCPLINERRLLKLSYKISKTLMFKQGERDTQYTYSKQLQVCLLPFLRRKEKSVVFFASGKLSPSYIIGYEESIWSFLSNGTGTNTSKHNMQLADQHLQNDSAYVEVRLKEL